MAQNRSDIVFFPFVWGGCFALYTFSKLQKTQHHRHPEACHYPGETAKQVAALVGFWSVYFKKNKATLVSKKTLTHKDIVEIVSQVVTSKNQTGETFFFSVDRLNRPEAHVVQQMQQPCCKQNTAEKQ